MYGYVMHRDTSVDIDAASYMSRSVSDSMHNLYAHQLCMHALIQYT
jgi:hypothetical protein